MKKVWLVRLCCEYPREGSYHETFHVTAVGVRQAADAASKAALKADRKLESVWATQVTFLFELDN